MVERFLLNLIVLRLVGQRGPEVRDLLGEGLVVGLLGVEPDGAVVLDPELSSSEAFPPDQARVVVREGAQRGSWLAQPEGLWPDFSTEDLFEGSPEIAIRLSLRASAFEEPFSENGKDTLGAV